MIAFEIPYPPTKKAKAEWNKNYGMNAFYSGKHWGKRKNDVEALHKLAFASMKIAGIKKQFVSKPVEIRFFWDDRMDIDNHAALGKAFVDAMKGYILPDDGPRWFRKVTHEFWGGGKIRVEVEELE